MTASKEFQRVEQKTTEASNLLGRIEAKLDALLAKSLNREEINAIKFPEAKEVKPISSGTPYTIKDIPPEESTIETPVSEAAEQPKPSTPTFVPEHLDTITPPVVAAVPVTEPSPGYDALTEGEAIKLVKTITDPVEQERYLAYERAHKNRDRVLEAIVVVPSEESTTTTATTATATKPATTTKPASS